MKSLSNSPLSGSNYSMNSNHRGKSHRANHELVTAIERDDYDDLMQKNSDCISRVMVGQAEIIDSVTDMVDVLGVKIQEMSASASSLVDRLSALDNMIDEEKRKWIIKVDYLQLWLATCNSSTLPN